MVMRMPAYNSRMQTVVIMHCLLQRVDIVRPCPQSQRRDSWLSLARSIRQERTGSPSSRIVQAPQTPCSQPTWCRRGPDVAEKVAQGCAIRRVADSGRRQESATSWSSMSIARPLISVCMPARSARRNMG